MKRIAKTVCLLAVGLCMTASAWANVAPATIFTSEMVLQCDREAPVWGWADPGEKVTVSFAGQTVSAVAGADGKWTVKLAPMKDSAEGRKLTISGKNKIDLENVLVGHVWVCSGQSNMQWSMAGSRPVSQPDIDSADFPLLRYTTVRTVNYAFPQNNVQLATGKWKTCTPGNALEISAVAFYFGRELHKRLNVPVGLLITSWGGTRIEPWTPPVGFNSVPELASTAKTVNSWDSRTKEGKVAYRKALDELKAWIPKAEAILAAGKRVPEPPQFPMPGLSHQEATKLYNGMIHPLIPMAISGAIWYQGESNGGEGVSYLHKLQALIGGWRTLWGQGDFPFGIVQLANYANDNKIPAGGDGWARLREAQLQAIEKIANTGLAVIIDVGEAGNIHPKNKYDVGLRLALWALATHYGKQVVYSGPVCKSVKVEGNKIRLSFDHVGSGLMAGKKDGLKPAVEDKTGKLQRFSIAGEDKNFVWADAVIDGDTVVVSSPKVAKPVAVRYAFTMNPTGCNFYNKEGLPASPFRTDTW